jgi:hypothetical protein
MSNSSEILTDTFGRNAPALSRFGEGATSLAEVAESLRQRDAIRDAQNDAAEKGGPVRRD